ncbi:unnamed protein product, partial [marine sediment metagenome]
YSDRRKTSLNSNATSIDWSPDGQFLYVSIKIDRSENMLVGNTNWNISDVGGANSRTSPTNYKYQFIPEVASGGDCWSGIVTKSPALITGGQLILCLTIGSANTKLFQYTLPIPPEIRQGDHPDNPAGSPFYPSYQPVLVGSLDLNAFNTADGMNDLQMSPDGTRMIGNSSNVPSNATLNQWNLSTPYDILGTLAYQPRVDIPGYDWGALHVDPSGYCLFLTTTSGEVHSFTMNAPWELSTLNTTPSSVLDVSAQLPGRISSVFVTDDNLYVLGFDNGDI